MIGKLRELSQCTMISHGTNDAVINIKVGCGDKEGSGRQKDSVVTEKTSQKSFAGHLRGENLFSGFIDLFLTQERNQKNAVSWGEINFNCRNIKW